MSRVNNAVATRATTTAAAVLALCASASAVAQLEVPAAQPPQSVSPTVPETAPLEQQKLDQFADAYLAIERIHARTATELKQAVDTQTADKLKARAETQIIEAVEQSGLRLDEFNQIADLLKVDRDLRQKVADLVQQRRKS